MLQVKQVKLTDVLIGWNATIRVCLTYLGFRKKVTNCCLPFQGFKKIINLHLMYLMWKTTFNVEIRCLEVKKQDAKYQSFVSRLKFNKEWARIDFRGWNASGRVLLRYLLFLTNTTKVGDTIWDVAKHLRSQSQCF